MITLRKNEQVEIYQVELALKEKTKQSPFIAVLILAQEQGEITAETLKDYLLHTLPIRACNNLLIRLTQQGYLEKKRQQNFRNDIWGRSFYYENESDLSKGYFITAAHCVMMISNQIYYKTSAVYIHHPITNNWTKIDVNNIYINRTWRAKCH